jgi:hypothetical protein
MKYKRIIKYVLNQKPEYDSYYPEHKPIFEKIEEMLKDEDSNYNKKYRSPEDALLDLIPKQLEFWKSWKKQWRDENITPLNRRDHIYRHLDFDITEEYIWFKIGRGLKNMSKKDIENLIDTSFGANPTKK